ncbi:MAG: hypothetical protein GKR92_08180 [Gammaproteobacteria bacterium]|nr:MAG: hypothetical protein GKR92_08180 [Gammaproteobacteria bacterium]
MSTRAGELIEIMKTRLEMQKDGITKPPPSVKIATETLVERLSEMEMDERIEINTDTESVAKYIHSSTGEILAEIHIQDDR